MSECLSLAILHGEQIVVVFLIEGIVAVVAGSVLLYVWLRHTRISALKLALSYFVLTALLYCVLLFTTVDNISMVSITLYLLGFVLSLPWSAIGLWFTYATRTSEINIHLYVGLMLLGTAVNAVLLYFAAVKMRRLVQ